MERRIHPRALLSSRTVLNVFRKGSALAGLVAVGALFGCGDLEEGESADFETRADEIVAVTQPREFKNFSPITSPSNGVGDPAFCTPNGAHSKIMFTRDTSSFIQGQADVVGIQGAWAKYGSLASARKLGGRPACGFLTGSTSPYPFILLAKGANAPDGSVDKRLFWSKGNWTVTGSAPAPTAVTPFAALDGTHYSTNGNPAVGTRNGQLVVAYLKDNGQLAANYWTGSTFSGTLTHPNLPTGWTGVGTPAIAFAEGWAEKFIIFVRAKNSSNQYRLYETFFENNQFRGAPGGSPSYQQVVLPTGAPSVQSDPAYEFDNDPSFSAGTLYYRNGTKLYQVSAINGVDQFNSGAVIKQVIQGGTTPSVVGNPAVIGGVPYEAGRHWILMRASNNAILWGESFNDEHLRPN